VNYTVKTWYLSLSPLTPGHDLDQCYSHSSPPPTIHAKNLGAHHILTINTTDPTPTSCTNEPPNHHAHSGSSHPQTSDGHNPHHQHGGHSLVTHTKHPHQASILSNSSDLAYLKSKAYSSLLCNATRTFQLHPTAPSLDLYSFLTLEDTYPGSICCSCNSVCNRM
jgi:hypothetical protein